MCFGALLDQDWKQGSKSSWDVFSWPTCVEVVWDGSNTVPSVSPIALTVGTELELWLCHLTLSSSSPPP